MDFMLDFFGTEKLPEKLVQPGRDFRDLAVWIDAALPETPLKLEALRKLLEVRNAVLIGLGADWNWVADARTEGNSGVGPPDLPV